MQRQMTRMLAVLVCAVGVRATHAYEFSQIAIESWSGTGVNEVLLVVDFWPGNGADDSFAFGFRFDDPQITGLDLLAALHAANNGLTYAESGGFVTDFWYDTGATVYHTAYAWPDSWWSYWHSTDAGEFWGYGLSGPGDRVLMDGDTDGWLAKPGADQASEPVTPLWPLGDMNCDGEVDFDDINPFVLALTNPAAYAQLYAGCTALNGDLSGDGTVDFDDINPFVDLLTS